MNANPVRILAANNIDITKATHALDNALNDPAFQRTLRERLGNDGSKAARAILHNAIILLKAAAEHQEQEQQP